MMAGSSSSAGTRPARARSLAASAPLSDLDRRILDLLSFLRVLTQTQLASLLSPEIPPRTLRYRTARLAKLGLIGRTRPYRERGSAPHHLWPTRKGEAIAEGGPPPRGGERREPNPLFLAHAAAISELYVALTIGLPELELTGFEREAEARETFRGYDGKEHAVAPDACIQIEEADGRVLLALVELDLGTMSARQLKAKAEGYGEYVEREGWRQRNPYCPPLLFLTTSEKRARSFLATCRRTVDRGQMLVAATASARDIGRSLTAREWLAGEREGVDLLAILRGARRPYDEALEQEEAGRREQDAERERLRSGPVALREHLRSWRHRDWGTQRLGPDAAKALEITIEREEELTEVERRALLALGGMFSDPLRLQLAEGEPSAERRAVFDELAEHQLARQREEIEELAERFGGGRHCGRLADASRPGICWRWPTSPGCVWRRKMTSGPLKSRSGCAPPTSPPAKRGRCIAGGPSASSRAWHAAGRRTSSRRSTACPCGSAAPVRRSPIPTLIVRATSADAAQTSPSAATSAAARSLRSGSLRRQRRPGFDRDLRTPTDEAGGEVFPAQA
jgi:protein involved in plasmid replication-relaxation